MIFHCILSCWLVIMWQSMWNWLFSFGLLLLILACACNMLVFFNVSFFQILWVRFRIMGFCPFLPNLHQFSIISHFPIIWHVTNSINHLKLYWLVLFYILLELVTTQELRSCEKKFTTKWPFANISHGFTCSIHFLTIYQKYIHIFNSLLNKDNFFSISTARKRSLGQGNVFTPVCHSVHSGGILYDVNSCLAEGGSLSTRGSLKGISIQGGLCLGVSVQGVSV